MKQFLSSVIVMTFLCSSAAFAQEKHVSKEERESNQPHHRITLLMENSHIPRISEDIGSVRRCVVPAWGLDYDFWLNAKWAIGLHNDLILQQYEIEREEDSTTFSRTNPITSTLVGIYKPTRHLALLAGVGREFEKEQDFNLVEFGAEYGVEILKNCELSLNIKYEDKFNAYNSWMFGVGFSKLFYSGRKKD